MTTTNAPSDLPSIYTTDQVPLAVKELFEYPKFKKGLRAFLPQQLYEYVIQVQAHVYSSLDFQANIIKPFLEYVIDESTNGLTTSGLEQLDPNEKYLFIGNHRDIGLDSAFLNLVLFEKGFSTCQIAIGDNLMKHRVAELAFRINKSFPVNRSGSRRAIYQSSVALSKYIHQTIHNQVDSIWIAQREGRAKDGNDRTQVGVLKMLGLRDSSDFQIGFKELNIVPVTISYELDPCDGLKTKEYIDKKLNPDYQKTFEEDIRSILQGFQGHKGAVHVAFGAPLNHEIESFSEELSQKELLAQLATSIDIQIHKNYQLGPINYVAWDLLNDRHSYESKYTVEQHQKINKYFAQKLKTFSDNDQKSARNYLLGMYANPLSNKIAAYN